MMGNQPPLAITSSLYMPVLEVVDDDADYGGDRSLVSRPENCTVVQQNGHHMRSRSRTPEVHQNQYYLGITWGCTMWLYEGGQT
jgi:hypothetical protein